MKSLFKRRLQLQLLFILLAAVLVATLSVLLISDAVSSAEGVLLTDAGRSLTAAVSELDQQYQGRMSADGSLSALPIGAQDTSLRGLSTAVLRSYPGIEGGYYDGAHFLGYSYPTHDTGEKKTDVPSAELDDILATIAQSRTQDVAQRILRGRQDLVVIEAKANRERGYVSWAMKRLAGRNDRVARRREILLLALVLAALASIAGTLATGVALQRGIVQLQSGLATLETDFSHRLPARNDELGEVSRSINRMADVRQKLESDLRREDRLRTIGRLVAGIAHEIRNPLNSIKLSIQYLERRIPGKGLRAEDLHPVVEEVDRLSSLLTNLLTFQKTRHPALADRLVAPVLEQCLGLVRRQADLKNVSIRAETFGLEVEAHFDPEQLTQVLMNLLLNAVEAAGKDGTVQIRVAERDATIGIEVRDSGPGLSDEQKEHLFEAFYTTKDGGTGTGKELVVNALHHNSIRAKGPLVKVNCAAIPETLLESELFGHEKGAFTNALYRRIGRFEEANGGTLFLDEIGELAPALQSKLLRAIQERTIERLGSNTQTPVDIRLITATARDLERAVNEGSFREDLYYRLNVVTIPLPPLRERRQDIPVLVQHFLGRSPRAVSMAAPALALLCDHHWPGNVRELENVVARALVLARSGVVTEDEIQLQTRPDSRTKWTDLVPLEDGLKANTEILEKALVVRALRQAGGNKTRAAEILAVHRRLLYEKLREYGLESD